MDNEPLIVAVQWTDSHRPTGIWLSRERLDHSEAICLSVGIVAQWDKIGMTLAMGECDGAYGSTFFIPAGAIKDVRVLEFSPKCKTVTSAAVAPKGRRPSGPKGS
jgi:hypothetical protein